MAGILLVLLPTVVIGGVSVLTLLIKVLGVGLIRSKPVS